MSLGLLCPGQGDQTPAMFGVLKDDCRAQPIWDIFARETGRDPFELTAEEMQVNAIAQPMVCAFQLAVWAAIGDRLPRVHALAGYSVGELAAYGCAGALAPQDVVALARRRALLMDDAFRGGGAMLALRGLDRATVHALCARHGVEIAIVNDDDRLVVGGAPAAVSACGDEALARGAKATPLAIHIPSHTSLMRPAVAPFRLALEQAEWKRPSAPVLAGISGAPVFAPAPAREALSAQLAQTIDWAACLDGLRERGCTVLLELGPGAGLARMARDRMPDIPARSVAEFNSLDGVLDWVARQLA
ncbi:acyltransferase domain-containing protein [Rhodoblastus sp.]|jgi:[acyl-carrier-protein] S-malonyltransferase|uniref:ACP S-malonyltransferase n=1 Tax=Rhodoblastus sp. TaxID=1962975 RepID=UPI002600FCE9|nr:acyltransferase domain-containing protein [Rhodoblastus sp.]